MKEPDLKEYMHTYVHCNIIFNSQDLEIAQVPNCIDTFGWMDKKLWYSYTMEYITWMYKREILPFAIAWMDLEIITQSEISQSEKDKHHMISLI